MIYIFCGEDSARARLEYSNTIKLYKNKNFTPVILNLDSILKNVTDAQSTVTLFHQKPIFINENISYTKDVVLNLEKCVSSSVDILLFESKKQHYELKKIIPFAKLKNYKFPDDIFSFLNKLKPKNKDIVLIANKNITPDNELFYLTLIIKRIKQLILIKKNLKVSKIMPWQKSILDKQAGFFSESQLIAWYKALYKLELSVKMFKNPLSIKDSLILIFSI